MVPPRFFLEDVGVDGFVGERSARVALEGDVDALRERGIEPCSVGARLEKRFHVLSWKGRSSARVCAEGCGPASEAYGAGEIKRARGGWGSRAFPVEQSCKRHRSVGHAAFEQAQGRMWILAMRPAPLWDTLALSADEDPVRMYCPRLLPLSSTARRTASHIFGTFCHSSMTWGRAPVSAKPASISTARRTASLSMWTMLSPARDSTMSFRNISPPSPSRLRIPQGGGL